MRNLDHPYVLRIYEFFKDREYVYLITEMCRGGEVFEKLSEVGYFSEREACRIFK